ncbi:MAG: TolC family protein [Spirochaetia bacterium]|jgi:outer membrane protein TolC|nr:TolC family protein [Spirochaetia bacterium]
MFQPAQVEAQQLAQLITVEKAVEMALEENLSLKADQYSLSEKKRSRDTRWNALAPDFGLSSSIAKTNEEPLMGDHHWDLSWQFSAQLALSASLVDGIRYLTQNYEAGLISYEDAKNQLKRDVKKSFYSLLVLEESLKLLENNIKTAEKSYRQADINYNNGLVSELDKLQALVTLESLRPDYVEASNNYNRNILNFKEMIGLENEEEIKLEGVIDPAVYTIDVNELIFTSLTERLDIKELVYQVKLLETDLSSSKNSRFPTLVLGYTKNMIFADDPFKDKIIGSPEESWKDAGAFSISLSLDIDNLIPWLSKDTEIKNKKERIRQAESRLSQALRRADIDIRTIVMNIGKSIKKIESLEYNEKLAKRSYELSSEGYNAGTVELLKLENSMNQLQAARLKLAEERYNYQAALLDLEYAINKSLEDLNE